MAQLTARTTPNRWLGQLLANSFEPVEFRMTDAWHEMQVRVRYAETDAMGFVHHANYLTYFEMGRTELYRSEGGNYRQMEEQGLYFVVVELNVKYKWPARYDDLLTVRSRVASISPVKLEHDYEIYCENKLLTKAHSVLACVDDAGKIRRIPDFILNGIQSA